MVHPSRRTHPHDLADALRARILRGELAAGELLPPERELALALGTNRTTLREALRALEAQGLVVARQGHGIRLTDFRRQGELSLLGDYFRLAAGSEQLAVLADLMRLRSVVTREAVVRAAELADAGDLAMLETGLEALRRSLQGGGSLMEAELGLYRTVVAAGKSLVNTWLFNSVEKVTRHFGETNPELWIAPPRLLDSWEAMVDAIRARSGRRAEAILLELLATTDRVVLDELAPQRRRPRARPRPRRRRKS